MNWLGMEYKETSLQVYQSWQKLLNKKKLVPPLMSVKKMTLTEVIYKSIRYMQKWTDIVSIYKH